jgi:uncharacterized membrane protein YhiD involved in acid resistance
MSTFQGLQEILWVGPGQIIGNVTIALICGFLVSLLYRWTYRGPNYSATFVSSLVSLAMITTVVISVIGNNLARAFGLVGALSIIRFRTAIKDPQDIVFVFFALAVGMAAGVGLHLSAVAGTIFVGFVIYVLSRVNYASPKGRELVLQFSFSPGGEREPPYLPVLGRYCKRHELVNVQSFGNGREGDGESLGLSFYIDLGSRDQGRDLVRDLGRTRGVSHVNLFFDEEPF